MQVRGHAAALVHTALLAAFGAEAPVARHALQLTVHLLHSLSARHCDLHRASGVAAQTLTCHRQPAVPVLHVETVHLRSLAISRHDDPSDVINEFEHSDAADDCRAGGNFVGNAAAEFGLQPPATCCTPDGGGGLLQ